ncbi:MAG: hypothetical protein LBE86_02850 [Gemmobacter sp.]|nr:hypothetical protein [Gemmobacter sp.]
MVKTVPGRSIHETRQLMQWLDVRFARLGITTMAGIAFPGIFMAELVHSLWTGVPFGIE